tara:strand:- start:149 stop:502 length:354 start_codon:yes stop_codon:yes gene_type:complete
VIHSLLIFLVLFVFGLSPIYAAEVLQVRGGSLLLIGDNNRTYNVELACVQLSPSQEASAIEWLREKSPRRTRVNLRPFGAKDGLLIARVTPIGKKVDLNQGLVDAGFAKNSCIENIS